MTESVSRAAAQITPMFFPFMEFKHNSTNSLEDQQLITSSVPSKTTSSRNSSDSGESPNESLSSKRHQKAKASELEPKRPVGRPRLYPKKEIDPHRRKRVPKGDKPLGRPRTAHLKPPVEKRPRGRPRKDAEAAGITPYTSDSFTFLLPSTSTAAEGDTLPDDKISTGESKGVVSTGTLDSTW